MSKKSTGGIVAIIIAIIGIFAGGGSTNWTFDFSQTTTTISSDDDVTNILTNLNLDLSELRQICVDEEIPERYQGACNLLGDLP